MERAVLCPEAPVTQRSDPEMCARGSVPWRRVPSMVGGVRCVVSLFVSQWVGCRLRLLQTKPAVNVLAQSFCKPVFVPCGGTGELCVWAPHLQAFPRSGRAPSSPTSSAG